MGPRLLGFEVVGFGLVLEWFDKQNIRFSGVCRETPASGGRGKPEIWKQQDAAVSMVSTVGTLPEDDVELAAYESIYLSESGNSAVHPSVFVGRRSGNSVVEWSAIYRYLSVYLSSWHSLNVHVCRLPIHTLANAASTSPHAFAFFSTSCKCLCCPGSQQTIAL